MTLHVPGWERPAGVVHDVVISPIRRHEGFSWRYLRIKRVCFKHAAHLMFLQGASPARLFLASCLEVEGSQLFGLHLLRFLSGAPWKVPYELREVLVAQILEAQDGFRPEVHLPFMLEQIVKEAC